MIFGILVSVGDDAYIAARNPDGSIVASLYCLIRRGRCLHRPYTIRRRRCPRHSLRRGRCPHRPYPIRRRRCPRHSLRRGRCLHRPVFHCNNRINAIGHNNILTNMPIIKFCIDIVDVLSVIVPISFNRTDGAMKASPPTMRPGVSWRFRSLSLFHQPPPPTIEPSGLEAVANHGDD